MVLTKLLRIAEYWISGSQGYPDLSTIQEYKRAGFNAIMIVEINYNHQMTDFDNIIIPNPQNNAFKTCIDQINSLGMDVYVLMNPVRYGTLPSSQANKDNFFNNRIYPDKFLSHIEFLVNNYNIAGIQMEEGYWEKWSLAIQMSFHQECRAKIPPHITYSANHASTNPTLVASKWDLNLINSGNVFDFVSYQTSSGDKTGNMTNYDIKAGVASWRNMIPNIPIIPFTYIWSQGLQNPSFLINVEYCTQQGYGLQVWPSSNISDYSAVKTIFDRYPLQEPCPRPQFTFNINQV